MRMFVAVAAAALLLSACSRAPSDPITAEVVSSAVAPDANVPVSAWSDAGGQGTMRFAIINDGDLASEDTYRAAMASLCGTSTICQVSFWTDRKLAPTQLPMSDEQVAAQVAVWARNLNTGHNELRIACRVRPGDSCF